MVATQAMVRVVTCLAHLGEQGPNFAWNDSLVLQSPEQVDLLLVRRRIDSHLRRCELREQLRQLAKLQEASVRVIRKIALGEHP
ncbi:hypothetical protein C665_02312 [Thauera aminoaromatica S2]|uniref:Uncharacterized protein n=1 Tax=Thauera aminoaromatica S2 TaxID=1234381 RepID=N6YA14_THASP|nr:hypothetical protein C665_02312 [Thauera aminoaromatica S2]